MFDINLEFLTRPLNRSEYWIRVLVYTGIIIVAELVLMHYGVSARWLTYVLVAGWVVLEIQRLHDANRKIWWVLLNVLPILGVIVVGCFPSNHLNNRHVDRYRKRHRY